MLGAALGAAGPDGDSGESIFILDSEAVAEAAEAAEAADCVKTYSGNIMAYGL